MREETFNTQRDFNKKFQSGMYLCSNCGELTADRYTCPACGWRADGLLKTWGKGYKYTILDTGTTEEIFIPIEIKGEITMTKRNDLNEKKSKRWK